MAQWQDVIAGIAGSANNKEFEELVLNFNLSNLHSFIISIMWYQAQVFSKLHDYLLQVNLYLIKQRYKLTLQLKQHLSSNHLTQTQTTDPRLTINIELVQTVNFSSLLDQLSKLHDYLLQVNLYLRKQRYKLTLQLKQHLSSNHLTQTQTTDPRLTINIEVFSKLHDFG
ncbi:hypothetical protein ACJX0J_024913 [Zea mays]